MTIITIIVIIVLLLLSGFIYIYNKLIKNKNRMQEAWSIIDVFLKKRHDMIPALVDVVKGYSKHEQTTLEEITRYRSQAMQATDMNMQMAPEGQLTTRIDKLLAVSENYPELKANESFLNLQTQLSAIENDLEKARRYYNGTVRENNIALESFPSNIIGNLFDIPKGKFFRVETKEKQTTDIKFQ